MQLTYEQGEVAGLSEVLVSTGAAAALSALRIAERGLERAAGAGLYQRPLDLLRDRVALLFFEDYERDHLFKNDRHLLRLAKRTYHAVRGGKTMTGFALAFRELRRALELHGWQVVVNDFELARANPHYPIGVAGYPHVLDGWSLPNPAVLGPGLFDHPGQAPELMEDPRFKRYLAHSEWVRDLFGRQYHDRCVIWFAGIDTELWPDCSRATKDIDVLVYEKFIWNRARDRVALLAPMLEELARRGLTVHLLRYGSYDHAQYRALLERSRSMLFLVEHETQGLACGEAMACNVPVLAWDQGRWLDGKRLHYGTPDVAATSVPYFDAICGERFASLADFVPALDRLWARLGELAPRRFVLENLSMRGSARLYLEHYRSAALA
jgi:hypothetical protein